jgi:hypothetical protein
MKFPGHTISKCIDGIDYGVQLSAIKAFLTHSTAYVTAKDTETKDAEVKCDGSDGSVDHVVGLYQESVYWDSAFSMAAIGQIAPYIESLFTAFCGEYANSSKPDKSHGRFEIARAQSFDPHYFFDGKFCRKDLTEGIFQLSEAIAIIAKMPDSFRETIICVFAYRNKMFHNGLEWPKTESAKFSRFLKEKRILEKWFGIATSGDSPWCYFMTTGFITHLLSFSEKLLQTLCEILDDIQPDIEPYADTLLRSIENKDTSQ